MIWDREGQLTFVISVLTALRKLVIFLNTVTFHLELGDQNKTVFPFKKNLRTLLFRCISAFDHLCSPNHIDLRGKIFPLNDL